VQSLLQWKSNKYYIYCVRVCVCVCVLPSLSGMQSACAILSSVACPVLQYFSKLSHKGHDFRKKVTEHKTFVSTSQECLSETFFILRRNQRDTITNVGMEGLGYH
jgi:hypothetical protein